MRRFATQHRQWSGGAVVRRPWLRQCVAAVGARSPCIPGLCVLTLAMLLGVLPAWGQEDQLNKVHVQPPASSTVTGNEEPAGAEAPPLTGMEALHARPGGLIRMNVDLVLVPVTVTDPLNRLVTGLEKEDFQGLREQP